MASESELTIDELDESQLSGEHGEMYLFQWLEKTERFLRDTPLASLKSQQSDIEKTLVKVITSPEPFPPPGRALRNVTARCFVLTYTRGETRTLFDYLGLFLKVVAEYKVSDKHMNKIAAFYCVGELMATFGSQFMSFIAEITTVTLKTLKSSNSSILRHHALTALKKALVTARKAVPDAATRDILKQARNGLTDKSLPVQRASAEILIVLYASPGDMTLADVELIVATCTKSLDNADQVTRRSLSQLVGHVLALTQVEYTPPSSDAAHKGRKDIDVDDGGEALSNPPALSDAGKKTILTPNEMLNQLSAQFNKPHVSRKLRIGIFDFYSALLAALGSAFVENCYSTIVAHFMSDIVSNPRNCITRYDTLLMRNLVGIILRDLIGVRLLSEQAQISAIQELSSSYLKRWPAMMPGQVAPNSVVLAIVLKEVADLLQQLGNAPPPVQDAIADPLVTLLSHTSHTVRVGAAWTLRCFCYSTPTRLSKIILVVMEMVQRDLSSMLSPAAPSDVTLRAAGHAYGLAALVAIIPERPLYVSYDISAKILDMATQLLKRAGDHDVKIAGVEVEVAWTSIASLMSLGPNFVRPHLPQLLVLWRNALPKPTSKDSVNSVDRSIAEWSFLLHVRESALGAILCFLRHNTFPLVTLDVARRITSLLSNALLFANVFASRGVGEDPTDLASQQDVKGLSLRSREGLLRRRVYQCFSALGFSSIAESTQATLLQSAVALFAGPDDRNGSSVQAAVAASAGNLASIWQSVDSYASGVTYIDILDGPDDTVPGESSTGKDNLNRDTVDIAIDSLLRKPVLGAREHDPLSLCQSYTSSMDYRLHEPPPPATAVVDSAIDLFTQLLPLQDLASTTRVITQLAECIHSPKLEKATGRKLAVSVNACIAIALFLRHASSNSSRQIRDTLSSAQLTNLLSSFLKDALVDGDLVLRSASSEAIGRLASLAGTSFLTSQIKLLVDQVVNNRDPYGRAGCALAFGAIYSYVGGLAAGPLLKTTVNVLMSLGNDPHPVVHFWALSALARVINAASLAYAPFVSSTLGMLLRIYTVESHELEGGSLANANISGDFPAYPVSCQIIDAVITVLGPDIQESPRTRTLVLNLVHEFSVEEDEGIAVEAIKCIQHFLMFAPEHVHIPELVHQFRGYLSSSRRPLKLASINALYQLVQKDALAMSKLGGDQLVEDLFGMLDDDSSVEGVRNVISSWLQQTVIHNPSAWIDLCQRIMSRTTASQQVADAISKRGSIRDDEGESLSVGMSSEPDKSGTHATSRWRTQLFALQCLHQICTIVAQSGRKEHLDIPYARNLAIPTTSLLVSRVPDLIKMAFTASTAYVTEIRLEGLIVLRDVIQIFSKAPDPDYEDALLLEQHQAPITAALTPAFSADATPEILASAVQACAIFVGCGIVKDASRMGRILKLLTVALEQSKDSNMLSIGDAGELGPNASAMLRISTLSAWAQLEVASQEQTYLKEVVKPHRGILCSLWIAALRDYASIRADSEVIHDASSAALDSSYSSLGKEVLLPYYLDSWPILLQAVASAMQTGDDYILAAMDGRDVSANVKAKPSIRNEPCAFFFILFGLVYEALASSSADAAAVTSSGQPPIIPCLQALKYLAQPEYSGKALFEPATFDELFSLCYRIAMTEAAGVQVHLIDVVTSLATLEERMKAGTKKSGDDGSVAIPSGSARSHCLRICAYVIRRSTSKSRDPAMRGDAVDRIRMITAAFEAFAAVGSSISTSQGEDIRAVAVLLYTELLQDETSDIDLAGSALPALKSILSLPVHSASQEKYSRLIHSLLSTCLLNIDEMRGRQGAISTRKVQNNLLAAVLVLTTISPSTKVGRAVIEHTCFLISQKLLDVTESISLTASHCAKTLVNAAATGNALLHQCAKLLLPALIEYIVKVVPLVNDGTVLELHSATIAEVLKAFSSLFVSVPENNRAQVLGIILPTIILLLQPSETIGTTLQPHIVSQLLSFASTSPLSFKEAAAKLDATTRTTLEQSIRKAVGNAIGNSQPTSKPQISLRSF